MGELLRGRNRQQGVSSARCLRGDAVAPVVALQAQSQAAKGRELSTLAPLRALRARTPEPAWARRAVDEGVRSCPRAGCGVREESWNELASESLVRSKPSRRDGSESCGRRGDAGSEA